MDQRWPPNLNDNPCGASILMRSFAKLISVAAIVGAVAVAANPVQAWGGPDGGNGWSNGNGVGDVWDDMLDDGSGDFNMNMSGNGNGRDYGDARGYGGYSGYGYGGYPGYGAPGYAAPGGGYPGYGAPAYGAPGYAPPGNGYGGRHPGYGYGAPMVPYGSSPASPVAPVGEAK